MTSPPPLQPDPAPIRACTIARDVRCFEGLIADMEAALGETWGDLAFDDALAYLAQPEAAAMEFVAMAVNTADETDLPRIFGILTAARGCGLKVILVADGLGPQALNQLLRLGAEAFLPYPLPPGALQEAILRLSLPAALRTTRPTPEPLADLRTDSPDPVPGRKARGARGAVLLPVQGMAGGVGATTFAVNLAWELTQTDRAAPPRVCLLDLDLQFGTVSTYLDLPRRDAVSQILSETETADSEGFLGAMLSFRDRLSVFTAPADMLALDSVTPADIDRLLDMAAAHFDYVVIDMPSTISGWSGTVLARADACFAPLVLDLRSAQNVLRFLRALKARGLEADGLRFVLNRAPGLGALAAKARVRRLAESLDIRIDLRLPDGGAPVTQANDHGLPLAIGAAKNPLRRAITRLAKTLAAPNAARVRP